MGPAILRIELPLDRLARQLGFQIIYRATFDDWRLTQTMDTIARIDVESRAGKGATLQQPNFLDPLKRFTTRE